MQSAILAAVKQICEEKNISVESVVEAIEQALAVAYRKDFGQKNQNIKVEFDLKTGGTRVFDVKTVVENPPEEEEAEDAGIEETEAGTKQPKEKEAEETAKKKAGSAPEEGEEPEKRFNPKTDIAIDDAKKIKKNAKTGDIIRTEMEVPSAYGRMAAQTAKQVIVQRLKESERDVIFGEFKEKEGEIISGIVQRRAGRVVLVDLTRAIGVLPPEEQVELEKYAPGQRFKFFVISVGQTSKGPEITLSRRRPEIVKELFALEIPEIASGTVEVKVVAREAGLRSKIAVISNQENIDPIGSCIGQKGSRVQTIISQLSGEKIDVIEYDEDPVKFITKALSPAKVYGVELNEENKSALVKVGKDQFSLAIGKAGQNVRLAAKLTGWNINIEAAEEAVPDEEDAEKENDAAESSAEEKPEEAAKEKKAKVSKKKESSKEEAEDMTEVKSEENKESAEAEAGEDKIAEEIADKTEEKEDETAEEKSAEEELAEKEEEKKSEKEAEAKESDTKKESGDAAEEKAA